MSAHPSFAGSSSLPNHAITAHSFSERGEQTSLLAGKRVVICEDEGMTQLQLRKMLARAGLVIAGVAGNGNDAVEIALREQPDIILMDIKMPGMNGMEATRIILQSIDSCVVMLTAFAEEEYQVEARRLGAAGYVVKPITSATLLPSVEEAYRDYLAR